jgi:hypothetical protein
VVAFGDALGDETAAVFLPAADLGAVAMEDEGDAHR